MSHISEEDLILYFYGDAPRPGAVAVHLRGCSTCEAAYGEIASLLGMVATKEPPARDDRYGLEVWQRIRHQLPAQRPWWRIWSAPARPVQVAAVAIVVALAAFVAGRYSVDRAAQPSASATSATSMPAATAATGAPAGVPANLSERARLAALIDHLEESERLLLDVSNDAGPQTVDAVGTRKRAEELVGANRLYRDAAVQAGDRSTASVLDDLERNLLDIVHAPAPLTAAQLAEVRARLDAAALVFKVRVLSRDLRDREPETPPVASRKTT
jgi:hypothetical protein